MAELLAFFDCTSEQWVLLRSTSPIESTFAPVWRRSKITKGPGRRARAWRWRSSSSRQPKAAGAPSTPPHLVTLVGAGAAFSMVSLVERRDQQCRAA
jgi:hypothetical protein